MSSEKTNKPETANELHNCQHSEKVYETEAIQTETAHSGSNTENLVYLKSTPSSTPASTTEPELTAQTEDVPDKAATITSVSVLPSNDSKSTITTVAEVHKSTETESHSSNVNNTESQSDPTQSKY